MKFDWRKKPISRLFVEIRLVCDVREGLLCAIQSVQEGEAEAERARQREESGNNDRSNGRKLDEQGGAVNTREKHGGKQSRSR